MEDIGIRGRIILKLLLKEIGLAGMGWIERVQVTYKCRAVVHAVMNLWASHNARDFSIS